MVSGSKKKKQDSAEKGVLLTTGATETANLQNIYDIAGNLYEWTLEFCKKDRPSVNRGGSYTYRGMDDQAKKRDGNRYKLCY